MFSWLRRNRRSVYLFLVLILFASIFTADRIGGKPAPKAEPLASIAKQIQSSTASKQIKQVVIDDAHRSVTVEYKDNRSPIYSSYPTDYGTVLLKDAASTDTKVEVSNNFAQPQSLFSVIFSLLPLFLIIGLVIYFVTTQGNSRGSRPISEIPKTRFTDVAGCEEAIGDMGEIVDFLKRTNQFATIGAKAPRGALLSGEPGTGKTLLARAVAGEAGVPFFQVSGADFVELFVGLGARRVRTLFKAARKQGKAIIFIDELDAIGSKRTGGADGSEGREHNRTVNALLTEMDGFEASNVIVLAATNSPDTLDQALTRAGRFDRKIVVDLPDWKGREGILRIHARDKKIIDTLDFQSIAKSTTGLAGADLENLVNEALINAVRAGRNEALYEDFMEALSTVTLGRARKSRVMTERDREITSWHEAGHAVVGLALDALPDPLHISIVPRGISGGHTKLQEPEDQFQSQETLRARLAMMMGGLAGERLRYGTITQGPGSDLAVATDLATRMVTKMGMGSTYAVIDDQALMVNGQVGEQARLQIETLIAEAVDVATNLLSSPRWMRVFDAMGQLLLTQDTVEVEDIQRLKNMTEAN